jgi:hypothetical protein
LKILGKTFQAEQHTIVKERHWTISVPRRHGNKPQAPLLVSCLHFLSSFPISVSFVDSPVRVPVSRCFATYSPSFLATFRLTTDNTYHHIAVSLNALHRLFESSTHCSAPLAHNVAGCVQTTRRATPTRRSLQSNAVQRNSQNNNSQSSSGRRRTCAFRGCSSTE